MQDISSDKGCKNHSGTEPLHEWCGTCRRFFCRNCPHSQSSATHASARVSARAHLEGLNKLFHDKSHILHRAQAVLSRLGEPSQNRLTLGDVDSIIKSLVEARDKYRELIQSFDSFKADVNAHQAFMGSYLLNYKALSGSEPTFSAVDDIDFTDMQNTIEFLNTPPNLSAPITEADKLQQKLEQTVLEAQKRIVGWVREGRLGYGLEVETVKLPDFAAVALGAQRFRLDSELERLNRQLGFTADGIKKLEDAKQRLRIEVVALQVKAGYLKTQNEAAQKTLDVRLNEEREAEKKKHQLDLESELLKGTIEGLMQKRLQIRSEITTKLKACEQAMSVAHKKFEGSATMVKKEIAEANENARIKLLKLERRIMKKISMLAQIKEEQKMAEANLMKLSQEVCRLNGILQRINEEITAKTKERDILNDKNNSIKTQIGKHADLLYKLKEQTHLNAKMSALSVDAKSE